MNPATRTATAQAERQAFDGEEVTYYRATRGDGEELRLRRRVYEGRPYLDLRIFARTEGGWIPTKRGVSIRFSELGGLEAALDQAIRAEAQRPRGM